jgi:hypothetical protein
MRTFVSSAKLVNCTFLGNTSPLSWSGNGGAMYNRASDFLALTDCLFSGNSAADGGGMYNWDCDDLVLTNCTFSTNSADSDGGGMYNCDSSVTLTNCIFWGNSDADGMDQSAQIHGRSTVDYCCIQGWTGNWGGVGNIAEDPCFTDPDGPDDDPNTWEDNDYRLCAGSPCIDAADNTAAPPDEFDLDEDGDTDEPIPFDLDGKPRFVDDLDTDDTGNPDPDCPDLPIVDMGAYEFQACAGDLDSDGDTDQSDLGILLADWACTTDCVGDLDGDDDTDQSDLGILLADWGCGT